MRLSNYIQRTRALGDVKVTPAEIDAIGDLIVEGATLSQVLEHRTSVLTPRLLLGVWRAARRLSAHLALADEVVARRAAAGQTPLTSALLKQTVAAHEIGVLERVEEMAPPGQVPEHRRRDAMKEAIALYNACLAVARKDGALDVILVATDREREDAFGEYVGTTTLAETPPHRWLAFRRGEAAGALRLELELPEELLVSQVRLRGAELSALSGGRSPLDLLGGVVVPDLGHVLCQIKDDEARLVSLRNAGTAYLELLCAPPVMQSPVAAIYVGRPGVPIGVAVVDSSGTLLGHGASEVDASTAVAVVERLVGAHPIEALVLPATAEDTSTLAAIEKAFNTALAVYRISKRALRSAASALDPALAAGMTESGKRALVLALRAVQPASAWRAVDPVSLGLAEYQQNLDPEDVRTALQEMAALADAGVGPEDLQRPLTAPRKPTGPRLPNRPLNPMIKSVDDLRPGMSINGQITNITQFGAFVNIGLAHEGLIHVSELADHFVNDPHEVVKVGQAVSARVLGVDRGRRRISLSLRSEKAPGEGFGRSPAGASGGSAGSGDRKRPRLDDIPGGRGGGPRRTGGGGGGERPAVTGSGRAQALADLEALFKK